MGKFIKQTLASVIGTMVGIFLFLTIGISGLVFLLISTAQTTETVKVKNKSVLVIDLATTIADIKPTSTLGDVISGERAKILSLRQTLNSIEAATKDKRINAIFLDGRGPDGATGYATLKEVRSALEEFRAAGKEIIAYDNDWSERSYYLSSVADRIILNPMGTMEINGLASQTMFFAGAFEKYGIGVQIVRVGDYKSAVEPLIRKNFSQENKEQTEALLEDIWQEFITGVSKSRSIDLKQLNKITDESGFLTAEEAKKAGLIDRIAYFDEVIEDLKKLGYSDRKNNTFRQISLAGYSSEVNKEKSSRNKIGVIYAQGTIVGGEGDVQQIGGESFARELRKLRQDKQVKAVVIRVNSPGGSATASEIILREIKLIAKEKPVIVSMGNVAASGGYWIATGANYIFAEPNTITGSIGVFGALFNFKEISNNNGITWDTVKIGEFADLGTATRPKTEAELKIFQKYVNQIYDLFLDKVATSRNLPKEKVAEIARGRVWSGIDAKEIGLVDELGGLEAAIAYAAKEAELGTNWRVVEYPKFESFGERFLKELSESSIQKQAKNADPLTAELIKIKQDLAIWRGLKDPKDVYAIFPYKLRID
ncbi:MAG: signal peptide peptidase SppA [Prochloraceae cyanobacterium]|nr:signal peptide peptidase SppA [Prochloraceae cyanobacterium]